MWCRGVTEASGSSPGRCAHPGKDAPVWDSHAAQEGELLSHLVVEVPNALEEDRRHLAHHVPTRVCSVQPCVLVNVPVPRGGWGELSYQGAWHKTVVLSCPPPSLNQQICQFDISQIMTLGEKWFDFHKLFLNDSYGSGYLIGLLYIKWSNDRSVNTVGM